MMAVVGAQLGVPRGAVGRPAVLPTNRWGQAATSTRSLSPTTGAAVSRRVSYALLGAGLAQGVAAGLLLFRLFRHGRWSLPGVIREIGADLGTFIYVAGSTTAAFSLFGSLAGRYADRLAQLASTDALTDLLNARAFHRRLHEEIVRATRYRQPLSLMLLDLDDLKRVNDARGHEAGDKALLSVAAAIRSGLREADLGARLGGDEFGLLAPNTNQPAALVLGERLRALVAGGDGAASRPDTTVSIGIVSFGASDRETATERSLLRAADAALYQAKREGGNRVAAVRAPR
jgi:diguanylate cyclase (GGDEF)-like protein